jgi:type II secretory pathway pseudopilin PulG
LEEIMTKALAVLALIGAAALPSVSNAQDVHQLPFASSDNTIELAVSNSTGIAASGITIRVSNIPSWLRFSATEQRIAAIRSNEEMAALFSFSVDKTAPVNKEHALRFVISAPTGERWTKEITISIAAPERFELFQNYPNPFSAKGGSASGGNPATAISYQLSANSRVSLKVFDLLGREIITLAEEEQAAGYHQAVFDANGLSSGTYVYQLMATDEHAYRQVSRKAMLLVK